MRLNKKGFVNMMNELQTKIKKKKYLLANMTLEKGDLQHPEVQSLSRELDELIVMALKANISNNNQDLKIG